jgi:oligopeptide/dipeptide ABC transporter ATP-binding protein
MSQLRLQDLRVDFPGSRRPAVASVSLQLDSGRVLALIGESGSGKTLTALSLLALLPDEASASGTLQVDDRLLSLTDTTALSALRGRDIGLVFQDPMSSLNPVLTIGEQVDEVFRYHRGLDRGTARAATIALLAQLGLPEPAQRRSQYPHQFSGGQRQRIAIAMAIAAHPAFLIADEPTTALDVTIQAQIMELLQQRVDDGMGLLLITHDIALAAENADDIAVIYAGRLVEYGSGRDLVLQPRHPYTALLLAASLTFTSDDVQAADDIRLPQTGCAFAPRCANASALCQESDPPIRELAGRRIVCHHPLDPVAAVREAVPS